MNVWGVPPFQETSKCFHLSGWRHDGGPSTEKLSPLLEETLPHVKVKVFETLGRWKTCWWKSCDDLLSPFCGMFIVYQ